MINEAKKYLDVIGFIIVRIHDEWRVTTKKSKNARSFKTDDDLIAFARTQGWREKQSELFPESYVNHLVRHCIPAVTRDRDRQLKRRKKKLGVSVGGDGTVKERFEQFHADNPHVYDVLVSISREGRRRGLEQWSIAGAFEVARYERRFSTTDESFKIRNDFKPHYARLIMEREPDLDGFFATRELTAL